jgi:outer membrane protein assembly factor BamB
VAGGSVYVGSDDGHVYAISATTKALRWSALIAGKPAATAALNGGALFVGSSNGLIYNIAVSNGAIRWTHPTSGPVIGISSTSGLVFAESNNGIITGYRLGGEQVWIAQAGGSLSTTPAISDNAVIVGAGDAALYVYTPYGIPMT